jgi:hypothetical protein
VAPFLNIDQGRSDIGDLLDQVFRRLSAWTFYNSCTIFLGHCSTAGGQQNLTRAILGLGLEMLS